MNPKHSLYAPRDHAHFLKFSLKAWWMDVRKHVEVLTF